MNEIEKALAYLKDSVKYAEKYSNTKEVKSIINTAITALEKQENGAWIPISERLPENNVKCLVTVQYENFAGIYTMVTTGSFNDKKIKIYGEQPVISNRKIIAWQPLPEPYKSEG